MKRSERERLIEHYLEGTMTSLEEQDFLIEVAANSELRTELKAYKVVESAVMKDRAADTPSYASLRTHMISVLAGTIPIATEGNAPAGPVASNASTVPPTAIPAASEAQTLSSGASLGATWMKWVAAVVATALFVAGAIILNPSAGPENLPDVAPGRGTDSPGSPILQQAPLPMPVPGEESGSSPRQQVDASAQDKSGRAMPLRQAEPPKGEMERPSSSVPRNREGAVDKGAASTTATGRNVAADSAKSSNGFNIDIQVEPPRNSR